MIDTYMDRVDQLTGFRRTPSHPVYEDPRYFKGSLYETVLDRLVAEAKEHLSTELERDLMHHRWEMCYRIPVGMGRSFFTKEGRRK